MSDKYRSVDFAVGPPEGRLEYPFLFGEGGSQRRTDEVASR